MPEEKGVEPLETAPILRDFPPSFDTARLTLRRPEPGDGPEVNRALLETWADLHEWMDWAMRAKSSTMGAINGEWKA